MGVISIFPLLWGDCVYRVGERETKSKILVQLLSSIPAFILAITIKIIYGNQESNFSIMDAAKNEISKLNDNSCFLDSKAKNVIVELVEEIIFDGQGFWSMANIINHFASVVILFVILDILNLYLARRKKTM